jgi:tetratricopeptide (TPR) repeat protein
MALLPTPAYTSSMVSPRQFGIGLLLAVSLASSPIFAQSSTSSEDAERYAERGQAALADGRLDDAEHDFEQLRAIEPNVAEVHAMLGRVYFQERKFNSAAAELQAAVKLKPTLPKARTLLSIALSETAEYQKAVPGLEACFHHSGDSAEKRTCGLQLERAYTGLKLDKQAVDVALQMDTLYPKDAEVLYHSSQIYGNMAFEAIKRMSEVAPSSPWRYLAAAEVNESQGATAAAIEQYRQVLAIDPNHPGIHYRIGRTLLAQGRKTGSSQDQADALKEFLAELQLDPSNANAAYESGEIYRNMADYPNAEKYFGLAIQYYPGFDDAQIGLATVYLAEGKAPEAVPALRKALAIDPTNEVAWYRLSQAERSVGDSTEQNKAMVQFRRLHQAQLSQSNSGKSAEQSEVTKQTIEDDHASP